MASTTFEGIREAQQSTIEALSPAKHSGQKFRVERGESDFREWARQNPQAAFRRFAIERVGAVTASEVSNLNVEETLASMEIVVAYPRSLGRYGPQNAQDMDDLIDADAFQIRDAVGQAGYLNWANGQIDAIDTHSIDTEEAVSFLVIAIDARYYRSMS